MTMTEVCELTEDVVDLVRQYTIDFTDTVVEYRESSYRRCIHAMLAVVNLPAAEVHRLIDVSSRLVDFDGVRQVRFVRPFADDCQ